MCANEKQILESFIFNDEVQALLEQIKNNVMDFNILEITGMGTQEIKHSNILAWLFGDNEHGLEYRVLECFLKKVIEANEQTDILKHYVYLPAQNRDIIVHREKDNIDLLIVDKANKIVMAIENKIYASERDYGEDRGQLNKYFSTVQKKYPDYENFYLYLNMYGLPPSEGNSHWMVADYEMIGNSIEEVLLNGTMSAKTELILVSYIDLLKRRNIMGDTKLEELCSKIWEKNAKALDILLRYRTTNLDKLFNMVVEEGNIEFYGSYNRIKTDASDKLYQKIFSSAWADSSGWAIDIMFEKRSSYIWIGYYHPTIPDSSENDLLQKVYKELSPDKKKLQKSVQILYIARDSVEELSDDDLRKKAKEIAKTLNLEIERFAGIVNHI